MSERAYKTPLHVRQKNKRHYMKMLKEGKCGRCGKIDDRTRQGRSMCAACNEKSHAQPKKPLTEERREADNATKREWAKMRRDAGLCVDCGAKDARTINGKCWCLQCSRKRSARARANRNPEHESELRLARKEKRIAAGMCSVCGKPKEEPDKKMCIDCRVKAKYRKEKHKINSGWMPRGVNGKCWQCNKEMAIEGKRLCQSCYDTKVEKLMEVVAKRKSQ